MFLEIPTTVRSVAYFAVSVSSLDRCFWKFTVAISVTISTSCFSILFGSMFLEIKVSVPSGFDVGEVSVSSLDRCFWKFLRQCQPLTGICQFQYPLWIDVFGNQANAQLQAGDNRFQYPLWIDVFGNHNLHGGGIKQKQVSVSSLDRCFWK